MKKIALLITLFSFSFTYSQAGIPQVVNDPQANSSLVTRIAQGAEQVRNGLKEIEFLEDAKKTLVAVNTVIRDANEIKEIYALQVKILNNSTSRIKSLRESKQFTAKEMIDINNSYSTILDSSMKTLETLDKLLSDDIFKMKDADRLKFIKEIRSELQQKYVGTETLYTQYVSIAQKRIQADFFKKK